jgi:hypothetical protein
MSKKPTTNEKLQFALTHTPTPQSCQIEISRHSWTPPHSFRVNPKNHRIEWHVRKPKKYF